MELALERLKEEFEVIVMDSPPVQLVSDAVMLAQFATSVLFVVRADSTPYPVARHALSRLHRADAAAEITGILDRLTIQRGDDVASLHAGLVTR